MVKGFIFFRDGKIPFAIDNYRMELFTDEKLIEDFIKEYNFKTNYILQGQCFGIGKQGQSVSSARLPIFHTNTLLSHDYFCAIKFKSPYKHKNTSEESLSAEVLSFVFVWNKSEKA